jgi:phosphoribosylaminoimidazole-succinocarboxamide synthase
VLDSLYSPAILHRYTYFDIPLSTIDRLPPSLSGRLLIPYAELLLMASQAVMTTSLTGLPKLAEGKVRDLYEIDERTLLFVASDRISAYDVIMRNVSFLVFSHLECD